MSIRGMAKRLYLGWLRLCAKSGVLAGLHYALFSGRFRAEQRAVLMGRVAYHDGLDQDLRSYPLLRRNIHRLEKGLLMRPRRASFGERYIGETVAIYARACASPLHASAERAWAAAVIAEYFAVVTDTPAIAAARRQFEALGPTDSNDRLVPYPHRDLPDSAVTPAALRELFLRRRSVRWFKPQAVPRELLDQAIEAARFAPSACNRQPFRFDITNDPTRAPKVAACAPGTAGYAENIPCVIVIIGDLSVYRQERDRHLIYTDAALASMQLMLMCESLGLSTCPINWPDDARCDAAIRKQVRIAAHERVVMLMAVGYADPDGGVASSQKKEVDQLRSEEGPR